MTAPAVCYSLWWELPEYQTLADGLRKQYAEQAVFGLAEGQIPFLLASLRHEVGRPLLVVTAGFREAATLAGDLAGWQPDEPVLEFPPLEIVPYHVVARSPGIAGQRLHVLAHLAGGGHATVVVSASALLRPLMSPAVFRDAIVRVAAGRRLDLTDAVRRLLAGGYERSDRVEAPGQLSVRGGILDVFPLNAERPFRIELFGDEVESVRVFDASTQRSQTEVREAVLPPAREVLVSADAARAAAERIDWETRETVARLEAADRAAQARQLRERVDGHLGAMDPAHWELYAPFMHGAGRAFLTDYFPEPPLVALIEPQRVREFLEGAEAQWLERTTTLLETGRLLPSQRGLQIETHQWWQGLRGTGRNQILYFSALPLRLPDIAPRAVVSLASKSIPSFRGQWEMFTDELRGWVTQGYACYLAAGAEGRMARTVESLREAGFNVAGGWQPPAPGQVTVIPAKFTHGFVSPGLRTVFLSDTEVFGRKRQPPRRQGALEGVGVAAYQDLKVGDYVVHVNHGIGQYLGVRTEEILGVKRDYLVIRYEGTDRLKVPTDQINLVQKYVGGEGRAPRLNRLSGNEWARVKQRVRESVREMAEDLLRLNAARQALEGHAFAPDTVWQREFEEAFPYEETPDQIRAIDDIKRDMERKRPMDRLLCGDVGFGKTEVAVRAVFKAVMDGKQVAVLVPTTILAQQHHLTFQERFQGFPVRIAMLSRFCTGKEQERTITALRKGEVDVVIGTHRLLGADVNFRDLGLLVIDEEHRFGVAHKEELKRLRATVDVLTLTATPIPRTLHMALAGMRDMSVIDTPPENRFPVETYVVEYDESLVRDGIEREVARGGQVFYVYNRVQGIAGAFRRLAKLVPDARIAVAHGQMPEDELEQVMLEFLNGEQDILLCTSIIESGLDIPNANTLVVEDADNFGLAQLYQIRGRVGRSHRLAYAYFTYRRDRVLSEVAQKRLTAIKEFTELGSGFKIALRDLEIRGAGNILGPEQHGFIVSVGFDLYCQLLEEAVRELKGERAVPRTEVAVELNADAYLDDAYVPEVRAKIEFYKRIKALQSVDEAREVEDDLIDRYGPLPPAARNLITLARIRAEGSRLGLLSVTQERDHVRFLFSNYLSDLMHSLEPLRTRYQRRLSIQITPRPTLRLRLATARPAWVAAAAPVPGAPADGGAAALQEVSDLLAAIGSVPEVAKWLGAQADATASGSGIRSGE